MTFTPCKCWNPMIKKTKKKNWMRFKESKEGNATKKLKFVIFIGMFSFWSQPNPYTKPLYSKLNACCMILNAVNHMDKQVKSIWWPVKNQLVGRLSFHIFCRFHDEITERQGGIIANWGQLGSGSNGSRFDEDIVWFMCRAELEGGTAKSPPRSESRRAGGREKRYLWKCEKITMLMFRKMLNEPLHWFESAFSPSEN